MSTRFDELAEQLATLNLQIRHAMEQAEAKVERVNELVRELGKTGLLARRILLGPVYERSYDSDQPQDSGQAVQAALFVPEGFGICIWDTEEYSRQRESAAGLEPDAQLHFHSFDVCSPAEKKFLLPCIEELLEDLSDIALIAASKLDPGPNMPAEEYFASRKADMERGAG